MFYRHSLITLLIILVISCLGKMEDYSSRVVKKTIGGADAMHDDSFLLEQTQHILIEKDRLYASMLLRYGTRVINLESGAFIQDFGGLDQRMGMAAGMCSLKNDDKIVVCDVNDDQIKVFKRSDLDSEAYDLDGSFTKPNDVASDGHGNLYVAEVGDNKQFSCIHVLDGSVKFVVSAAGYRPFTGVNYIAYDPVNERVVASDTDGNLVGVFTSEGEHLFNIDEQGEGEGQLSSPQGVAVDKEGNILVCDQNNNRVQVFSKDGRFLSILGGGAVDFSYPFDVVVQQNGDVAVVDGSVFMYWSRVQIL